MHVMHVMYVMYVMHVMDVVHVMHVMQVMHVMLRSISVYTNYRTEPWSVIGQTREKKLAHRKNAPQRPKATSLIDEKEPRTKEVASVPLLSEVGVPGSEQNRARNGFEAEMFGFQS